MSCTFLQRFPPTPARGGVPCSLATISVRRSTTVLTVSPLLLSGPCRPGTATPESAPWVIKPGAVLPAECCVQTRSYPRNTAYERDRGKDNFQIRWAGPCSPPAVLCPRTPSTSLPGHMEAARGTSQSWLEAYYGALRSGKHERPQGPCRHFSAQNGQCTSSQPQGHE